MEEKVLKILNTNSCGSTPSEAADVIRDFFCADATDENYSDNDSDSDSETVTTTDHDIVDSVQMSFNRPLINTGMLPCDSSPLDDLQKKEEDAVDCFLRDGCHCILQCHTKFTRETLLHGLPVIGLL